MATNPRSQFNVLVVEDDTELRNIICELIQEENFNTFSSPSVEEAISTLTNQTIHFVLSDVQMPKKSGIELLEQIQKSIPHPPQILLMTGHANITMEQVNDLGILGLIYKPEGLPKIKKYIVDAFNQVQFDNQN